MMPDAEVALTIPASQFMTMDPTNKEGHYEFGNVFMSYDYELNVKYNDDLLNWGNDQRYTGDSKAHFKY